MMMCKVWEINCIVACGYGSVISVWRHKGDIYPCAVEYLGTATWIVRKDHPRYLWGPCDCSLEAADKHPLHKQPFRATWGNVTHIPNRPLNYKTRASFYCLIADSNCVCAALLRV